MKHGESKTRIYIIWNCMKYRCSARSKHAESKTYGGRGITVCAEWLIYENFKKWALENGYAEDLTIERINNDAGYCPENCMWIPKEQQHLNRSNSVYVDVSMPLVTACRQYKLPYNSTRLKVKKGQDINEIIKERRIADGRKNV